MDVVFFPRNDYPSKVEVCNHRLGKKMTYTDQTDGLHYSDSTASYIPYTTMAKTRNIKVGCFVGLSSAISDPDGIIKSDYNSGNIWLDAYSLAPNIQDKVIHPSQYGNITQEEWNAAYNNYLYPNFYAFTGKKPVALSYSYGTDNFKAYVTQFLGARNSLISGNTDYGVGCGNPSDVAYSFSVFNSKMCSMRWYDQAKANGNDFQGQLAIVSAKIDETMLDGGWLNNFTHWHNYYSDGNEQWAEAYLNLLASKNTNDEIYFAGYGEALAYLVYRQLVTKVVMYSPVKHHNVQLVIMLETNNTLGVDTDLLQVPISVKFSTAGTPLEGQTIKSNCNIISLRNNQYIVEIPYGRFPIAVIDKIST